MNDNKNEIWKDVKGFSGFYQVNNKGKVKSVERDVIGKNNSIRHLPEKIISDTDNGKGYRVVTLYNGTGKRTFKKVHQLVAEAFIPNPNNLPEVNHIDGDKTNNCLENLEWCTTKENCEHRQRTGLGNTKNANEARKIKIRQYDINTGETIKIYNCAADAAKELGTKNDAISRVVRGERKSFKVYGFEKIE